MSKKLKHDYPDELVNKIDLAMIEGWKLYTQRKDKVVMVKHGRSSFFWHCVWAILTAWWSFGLVNVLYWAVCRYGRAEYLTLRVREVAEPEETIEDRLSGGGVDVNRSNTP